MVTKSPKNAPDVFGGRQPRSLRSRVATGTSCAPKDPEWISVFRSFSIIVFYNDHKDVPAPDFGNTGEIYFCARAEPAARLRVSSTPSPPCTTRSE